jgi:hypothetical protein
VVPDGRALRGKQRTRCRPVVELSRTAELAWVREAKRNEKRGNTAKARHLAQAVVDKWRFADDDIPSVREMKAMLARLR